MRFPSSCPQATSRRNGMVLLVVMTMLSLFASVALSFVFYADSEAYAAQMARQSQVKDQPYIEPEVLAAYFLNQLIYPTDNIYSALRGWDMARSIYGYNPAALNYTPYNGAGRGVPLSNLLMSYADPILGVDNFYEINYQKFSDPSQMGNPTLNYERKPEYYGRVGDPNYRYVGGANPPWTSYDTNSLFLAEVAADGTVVMPSFYRPWLASAWANAPAAAKKYMSLRPDGSWHPGFANKLPDSDTVNGPDVRNLDFGPGMANGAGGFFNNDSNWIDMGFPPMTAPNGKRFKVLVAPLIVDLSNRLHLWAHGNRTGGTVAAPSHVSNQGFGPTEVNLGRFLNMNALELQALFNLKYGGPNGTAASVPVGAPVGFRPTSSYPFYGNIDANALDTVSFLSTNPLSTPWAIQAGMTLIIDRGTANAEAVVVISVTAATNSFVANFAQAHGAGASVAGIMPRGFPFATNSTGMVAAGPAGTMSVNAVAYNTAFPFPTYPSSGWNNANGIELTNNPLAFNLRNPVLPNIGPLPLSHQEALMRFGHTNSPALTSEIFRRMPNTFSNIRTRNMVTMWNTYLDRIGASPVIPWDPTTPATNPVKYQLLPGAVSPSLTPPGPIPAPAYSSPIPAPAGDYTPDWRSNLGTMLRVNLNRPLLDFPPPTLVLNAAEPNSKVIDTTNAGVVAQFNAAQTQRQQFAQDIYKALIRVTGAQDPNTAPPANVVVGSPDYVAARWLAQLAVNIVDYIDDDDYSTPFNWNAQAVVNGVAIPANDLVVFGTELPRLVLNEALALYDNDPNDLGLAGLVKIATTGKLNVWAELHDPFANTPGASTFPLDGGNAKLQLGPNGVYQVWVCNSNAALSLNMRDPGNNLGDPDYLMPIGTSNVLGKTGTAAAPWGANAVGHEVLPANGRLNGTTPILVTTIDTAANGGASEVGNTVTITTTANHNLYVGQTVVIAGLAAGYNGTFQVLATPTLTTFTYTDPTPGLAASGSGTVSVGNNDGFYVLGPAFTYMPPPPGMTTRDPSIPSTSTTGAGAMSITPPGPPVPPGGTTLLLRRLAIPHLPPNPAPGPLYNPYITVDYLDSIKVWDNRQYDNVTGLIAMPPATSSFYSFGRKQPYSAYNNPAVPAASQVVPQAGGISPAGQPINTFYYANGTPASGTLDTPFTWLTHLDRSLVNQMELRQVSGYKPHELTQQFITYNAVGAKLMFQHRAPWNTQGSMIYRALELLGTPNNMLGTYPGGRWHGNVNLNTLTELEVLQALGDAQDATQAAPLFTQADVALIYAKLITSRNVPPGTPFPVGINPALLPTSEGTPFQPFSADSVNKTWTRPDPTTGAGQLFAVGGAGEHPYRRSALLQKIFNNITTTSNVFAVYWTVGYFEVLDETVRPVRLGAEIGRSENRHIRNRFFAIVDRSALKLFNTASAPNQQNPTYPTDQRTLAGRDQPMYASPFSGTLSNGQAWTITPGMLLEIDSGASKEVVAVKTVNAPNFFTADFTMPHNSGIPIICRGNPGPRANVNNPTGPYSVPYNPRQDTGVVLHLSVIQ